MAGESVVRPLIHLVPAALAYGTGVLCLGLGGAWYLSRRILDPLDHMTVAAEGISATNLSQRIDVAETRSELGRLALVLNRMFGRLEAAFERQTQFTADASHELRTPVAVILAESELTLARERTAAEYRASLEACQRASKRMKHLVDNLLTLARAEAGRLGLQMAPVDLRAVAENAALLTRPLAEARIVAISWELDPVVVAGDAERLGQVVLNLLTNAITYNRTGGTVRIRLATRAC